MTTARPSRRRFLATTGALAAVAMAGCAGKATRPAESTPTPTPATSGRSATPVASGATSATPDGTEPPTPAASRLALPTLTAPGSPGGPLDVAPPGKVVLLDFFATWCPPCEAEMPNLAAVRRRFDGGSVLLVSITQEPDHRGVVAYWETHGGSWPVAIDPALTATQQFRVTRLPTIIVLAADGTETFRHVGYTGEQRLVGAVEAALAHDESSA
ncbi:TlpA family protein disulfide reductase [Haloglomus litoreum]|uniref:TlpA family protein disulfide reductase n=1 Tax=Haloglomus litoreum TaxID=3034026 RepID=UPI0023E8902C|nr:redoxin family protein [Haloglomus sp. DT116]